MNVEEVSQDTLSDSAVKPNFEGILPLPFKVIFFINLGICLWSINISTFRKFQINVLKVVGLSDLNYSIGALHNDVFNCGVKLSVISFISYIVYQMLPQSNDIVNIIPLILIFYIMIEMVVISQKVNPGKKRLFESIKRILVGNIDPQIRNNDILLADTLTSYSKVLNDFVIFVHYLCSKDSRLDLKVEFFVLSFPTLIRMRQCLIEYKISNFRNRQHLLNCLKYFTNLSPTLLNLLIKQASAEETPIDQDYLDFYTKLWVFSIFINSSYTFIWDIVFDWNFNLFQLNRKNLLRQELVFKPVNSYYMAIITDFVLRFVWVWKFVPGFFLFNSTFGYFVLEFLEILRRWVWVFIKVEIEYIKLYDMKNNDVPLIDLPI